MGNSQAASMESAADVPAVPLPRLAVAYARDQSTDQHHRGQRNRARGIYTARAAQDGDSVAVRLAVGAGECRNPQLGADTG